MFSPLSLRKRKEYMEKFGFDFSREEDQKKFDKVNKKRKQKIINAAHEDAISINERDKEKPEGYVENQELGITFIETIQDLTPEIQKNTGLKRLRRRKIVQYPKNFYADVDIRQEKNEDEKKESYEWPEGVAKMLGFDKTTDQDDDIIFEKHGFDLSGENNTEIWNFLTEGRFPSYKTWTHKIGGDWENNKEAFSKMKNKFLEDSSLFEEFFPEDKFLQGNEFGIPIDFYKRNGDDLALMAELEINQLNIDQARQSLSYFHMGAMDRGRVWAENGVVNSPVFVFGAKNPLLKKYIESIISNADSRKILEQEGWTIDEPLEMIDPNLPENEKYKNLFSDPNVLYKETSSNYLIPKTKIDPSEQEARSSTYQNMSIFENLFEEKDVCYYHGAPPCIPIVRTPEIAPFRLSNAEFVIMPNGKELEIIFFETD